MHARWQGARFPPPVATGQSAPAVGTTPRQPLAAGEREPERPVHRAESAETHNAVRQNYAAMLENIDAQIGRFLDLVRQRGELERTLIVYSSDHGEMLGDHNRWGKSVFYQPSAGVPLVVAGPGVLAGVESDALLSTHDLTATFLELAGAPPLPGMDSRSLLPVLTGRASAHREYVRSGLDSWRMVWDGRHKLVRTIEAGGDGEVGTALFDLAEDPRETRDVAAERPAEVARLSPLLAPVARGTAAGAEG
jgi:arylsulfatase A-like enzyme